MGLVRKLFTTSKNIGIFLSNNIGFRIKRSIQLFRTPKSIALIFSIVFIAILAGFIFRNELSTFFSNTGSEPVAYFKFNEGVGTTVNDSGSARINSPIGHSIVGPAPSYIGKAGFSNSTNSVGCGEPAYQAGDLLLFFVESANQTITAPSGWVEVPSSPQGIGTVGGAGGVRLAVFYKFASASESGGTIADTGDHTTCIIASFRNVDSTSPFNASAGSTAPTTSALSWPSVTTTIANTLIINAIGLDDDSVSTNIIYGSWTNPSLSSITERHDRTSSTATGGGSAFATGIKSTPGSTGSTTNVAVSTLNRSYLTLALSPVNGWGGEPTWKSEEECVSGQCLYFDGSEDAVTVGNTDPIDFDSGLNGDMTFSSWIRPLSIGVGGTGQVFAKGTNTYLQVVGDSTDGKVDVQASLDLATTDATVTITNGIELQKWQHVSMVYADDGDDEIEIYIDGDLRGTSSNGSGSPATSDDSDILIGGSVGYFHGYIDEFKVYDYAQNQSQVQANTATRGTAKGVSAQFGESDLSRKLTEGLLAYWKMDETVGSTGVNWTVTDNSGNGKNGTGASDAGPGSGKFGNGGTFDGVNDYVSVADGGSSDILRLSGATNLTLSAWVNISNLSSSTQHFIVSKYSFSSGQSGYSLLVDNTGAIRFDINGNFNSKTTSTTPISAGSWYNIAGVLRDGNKMEIYVNGALIQSWDITATSVTAYTNALGIASPSNNIGADAFSLAGSLDEVRIYNRALDTSEIKALYEYAPGPVGWWKMDSGVSGDSQTILDSSGNGNDGSTVDGGNNTGMNCTVSGKFGKGCKFDGADDEITVATGASGYFDDYTSLTVSVWAKFNTITTLDYIVANPLDNSDVPFAIGTNASSEMRFLLDTESTGLVVVTASAFNVDANWHHYSGRWDGSTVEFFIDGVSYGTTSATGSLLNTTHDLRIGNYRGTYNANNYFDGIIDDVRIYNYARTQEQIINDMNAGHPSIGTPVGSTVLHLKMNEGYGTTVNDSSPQENNGTFGTGNSAPTWTNDGKFGKALSFDGTNDYVAVGDLSTTEGQSMLTISAWVKADILVDSGGVVSKSNTSSSALEMISSTASYGGNNDVFLGVRNGSNTFGYTTGDIINTGVWNHWVMVFDGTQSSNSERLKFYFNGKLQALSYTGTIPTSTPSNSTILDVGRYNQATYFKGSIDDVRIYPFALSADQVKTVMNQGEQIVMGASSTGVGGTSPSYSGSREYCVPGDTATCNAPVGEWKFDEGVGGTANDTSGNGNIGNFGAGNSAPTWSSGKSGKALSFDGNDYVSLTNSSLAVSTNLTVSAWIKRSSTGSFQAIYDSGTATNHWYLSIGSNDRIDFAESGILDNYGNSTITDTGWHHIAVVKNGDGSSNITFYLDGVQDGTASVGSVATPSGNPQIARNSGGSDYFNGRIDSVRIYNYARTPAQIAWEYNRGAPVAHYQLNECTGTTVYNAARTGDNKSVGNNGTLTLGSNGVTSAGTCATSGAWANGSTGKHGASLSFDGSDDYVSLAASNTLFPDEDNWSVGMWFKFANTTITGNGKGLFVAREDATGRAFTFEFLDNNPSEDTLEFYYDDGGGDASTTIATVSELSTNWHYITASYDGSVFRVYLDGRLEQNISSSFAGFGSGVAHIGAYLDDTNTYFNGQIDEVKIFNYALTTDQIKTEMAGGAVRFE